MPTFFDDLDVVDQSTIENTGPQYPVAQWLHGDPKMAAVGGVFVAVKLMRRTCPPPAYVV